MTYKSLMVHLELNADNEGVLNIAAELGQRFNAKVIGIAACQPIRLLYDEGFTAGEVLVQDRAEINKELAACKNQFITALKNKIDELEWRCDVTYGPLADYVAEQSRAADLIITGKDLGSELFGNNRRVNIGDLIMQAGRPVLLVPQGISSLPVRHVFIGCKQSREARRAMADALPLLKRAGEITLLEVTSEKELAYAKSGLKDVADWLSQHGVQAKALALVATGPEIGYLQTELLTHHCDLLVAGAYGHSRLGEWVFGGVTRDILMDPDFCVLISH